MEGWKHQDYWRCWIRWIRWKRRLESRRRTCTWKWKWKNKNKKKQIKVMQCATNLFDWSNFFERKINVIWVVMLVVVVNSRTFISFLLTLGVNDYWERADTTRNSFLTPYTDPNCSSTRWTIQRWPDVSIHILTIYIILGNVGTPCGLQLLTHGSHGVRKEGKNRKNSSVWRFKSGRRIIEFAVLTYLCSGYIQ